jgi:hypothetical protein
MSDRSDVEATLTTLQQRCADVALILSCVATCPDRLSRLWPAVVRELHALRGQIDAAIPQIEQAVEGNAP